MHLKYKVLFSSLAALFCVGALTAGGEKTSELGGRPVSIDDESKLALMIDRLIGGLKSGNTALYANFLSDDYFEFFSNKTAKSSSKVIVGKSAFLQKTRLNTASEFGNLEVKSIELADETAHAVFALQRSNNQLSKSIELSLKNTRDGWRIVSSSGLSEIAHSSKTGLPGESADKAEIATGFTLSTRFFTDSKTFEEVPLSEKHGVQRLSKNVTKDRLDRSLFRMPHGTAFYSSIEELNSAPFVRSSYVQLVTDPGWNRIVYGDYERFLKAYDASETDTPLNRPYGIAVDAQGLVYVADAGNGRIVVLKLTGKANDLSLTFLGEIGKEELTQPKELAWDDRGTIGDRTDDLLWVTDQQTNAVFAFRTDTEEAEVVVEYRDGEFISPSAIAVGRFDGRSDGLIYVADNVTDQLHQFFFDGEVLRTNGQIELPKAALTASLASDHWGNVFLADRGQNAILKFSPKLEFLGMFSPQNDDFKPGRFQTLFSQIHKKDADAPIRAGYNNAFLLEDWTENSGGRRLHVGLEAALEPARLSQELDLLIFSGMLTDPANVKIDLIPQNASRENVQLERWLSAGEFNLELNRDDQEVAAGFYSLKSSVVSTYGEAHEIIAEEPFYLPLYIYENCGSPSAPHNRLIRGAARANGSTAAMTVVSDEEEVVYRFTGLNPDVAYETRLTYYTESGAVTQEAFAKNFSLHAPMAAGQTVQRTAWLAVPSESVENGVLELKVRKTEGVGPASVAEIWLREADFDAANPPLPSQEASTPPESFVLSQNYPNPFNPSTNIKFGLPQDWNGRVTLRIFNMMGQLVRELVNEDLTPGNYSRTWRGMDDAGRKVASGVYVYQLRAGTFVASNKMLMMK